MCLFANKAENQQVEKNRHTLHYGSAEAPILEMVKIGLNGKMYDCTGTPDTSRLIYYIIHLHSTQFTVYKVNETLQL